MLNAFKLARELDGLRQRDLQLATGLNKAIISAIETGRIRPSRKEATRLIGALPSYKKAVEMLNFARSGGNEF